MTLAHSKDDIVLRAREERDNAYAPYSEFDVGAIVETHSGDLYPGVNVEISGRTTSIHAEMMAVFNAVADGHTDLELIAISSESDDGPCGLCLHTLSEFEQNMTILVDRGGESGVEFDQFQLADEYNHAYRPKNAPHHDHH